MIVVLRDAEDFEKILRAFIEADMPPAGTFSDAGNDVLSPVRRGESTKEAPLKGTTSDCGPLKDPSAPAKGSAPWNPQGNEDENSDGIQRSDPGGKGRGLEWTSSPARGGASDMTATRTPCAHEWECTGVDTGGWSYRCRRCGEFKTIPYSDKRDLILTDSYRADMRPDPERAGDV